MGISFYPHNKDRSGYEKYDGCVLSTFERNGYNDSDFYAVCWDEETQSVVNIEYATTRHGGSGTCSIDATDEVVRKAYRYYRNTARALFDRSTNKEQAQRIRKGDTVRIVRGRKVPQGTTGTCFWEGRTYNSYSHRNEEQIGVDTGSEKVFVPREYAEAVGWETRLIRGKQRKDRIRHMAIRSLPYHYRGRFGSFAWMP